MGGMEAYATDNRGDQEACVLWAPRCLMLKISKDEGGEQRNIEIAKSIARGGSALPLCGIALSLPKRKIYLQTLMFFPLANVHLHKTHIGSSLIHIYY